MKKTRQYVIVTFCLILCLAWLTGGCNSSAKTNALIGTGVGALIGQAVGGDTGATLVGAGVGAGVGYLIGNSQDKKAAEMHDPAQPTPLTGTRWKIVSLVKKDTPEYTAIFVEFRPDGKVVTTRHEPGGTMTVTEEQYRIVGDTLIVNKPGYIINAKYQVQNNQMIIDCEQFRAVLEKV